MIAAPGMPCWRDGDAYAPVLAGGRPLLAWELLRRDPAYRPVSVDAGIASQWGLHFRG